MNSPLQLKGLVFTDIKLSANPKAAIEGTIHTGVELKTSLVNNNKRHRLILLRANLTVDEKAPGSYFGTIECVGEFIASDDFPEERLERLTVVNGASILYGAIRELVANLTARGPHPTVTLSTLSFADAQVAESVPSPKVAPKVKKG